MLALPQPNSEQASVWSVISKSKNVKVIHILRCYNSCTSTKDMKNQVQSHIQGYVQSLLYCHNTKNLFDQVSLSFMLF